jgi:ribonuclease HI
MAKRIDLWTDGACRGNPGPGGWGAILLYKEKMKIVSGYEDWTTNNKMELMAVIGGLQVLKEFCEVTVYTDSKYVVHGMSAWVHKWIHDGWKLKNGESVKNVELWKELYGLQLNHDLSFKWVKGHSGLLYNEKADEVARAEIDRLRVMI